jgi:predicted Zn-dependent protease
MTKPISKDLWDNKKFALLSAAASRFPEENMIRMDRRGWSAGLITHSPEQCLKAVSAGTCSILIVHDTPEVPASFLLRAQLADPVGIISPTLVLVDPAHQSEAAVIKDLGQPDLVNNPLNPGEFTDAFEWMLRRWQTGNLKNLLAARRVYIGKDFKKAAQMLTALRSESDVQHLVTSCVAQLLMKQGQYKQVESYLLQALKAHPRNIGLVANLSELYLRAAMPNTALKVLEAARKNHGSLRPLYPDQIQAHIMLGQIEAAIPLLESLVREDYRGRDAGSFLARCLMTEGHTERLTAASNALHINETEFKTAWNKLAS